MVANLLEFNQLGTTHLAAVQTPLTHRARNVVAEEKRLVQLTGKNFNPNFFVFLMQGEKT